MPCLSGVGLLYKIMSHKTRKNVPVISKFFFFFFYTHLVTVLWSRNKTGCDSLQK